MSESSTILVAVVISVIISTCANYIVVTSVPQVRESILGIDNIADLETRLASLEADVTDYGDAYTLRGHPPEDFAYKNHSHPEYTIGGFVKGATHNITIVESDYTVSASDTTIIVNPRETDVLYVIIPEELVRTQGKIIAIKYSGIWNPFAYVEFRVLGSNIDGGGSSKSLEPHESIILQSDGENWYILSFYDLRYT